MLTMPCFAYLKDATTFTLVSLSSKAVSSFENTFNMGSRAGRFFRRQNFENCIVQKYVTLDVEYEYGIYLDIKTVLTHGVFV